MEIILILIGFLLVLFLLYAAIAYRLYHRVLPADSPCQDCSEPVQVAGFDLYFRQVGRERGRSPVVLLHGGPSQSSLSFKNSFDFLAEERRVIYYDQRGSGCSQVRPDPSLYTLDQLVAELEALRREQIRSEKIVVVGHSFGSALAQRYALQYPHHVDRLVLIGGVRINNGIRSHRFWKWIGPAFYSFAEGLPPRAAAAADEWFTRGGEAANLKRLFDPRRRDLLAGHGPLHFAPWLAISLSAAGYDYRSELSGLRIPTLVLFGKADAPYTGRAAAEQICASLPLCNMVEFETSGHWPFLEEPEKFRQVLGAFLEASPSPNE
jgi:proline iminopeptidase